jgi:Uma2 family endonuclease
MTPQDYLAWEEKQPIRYEYLNGDVFAMTGEQFLTIKSQ